MVDPSLYDQLTTASDALDLLLRETSGPIRDQRRFDELEAEAQRIGRAIPAAFRGRAR